MKKVVFKIIGITVIITFLSACGAKKAGCGLTSDIEKIEQNTTIQKTTVVASEV